MSVIKIEKIKPEFEPLVLSITITNKTEYDILERLSSLYAAECWDCDLLNNPSAEETKIIDSLLTDINKALQGIR